MALVKRYDPGITEPRLKAEWQEKGIYRFSPDEQAPIFSIDTPPPTVSGQLHLGHVYSYSHADFIARFWRMRGFNVFYPMGFDDNGLPTERLVEKRMGITAEQVGRKAFIEKCLQVSEESEKDYQALWQRLGLSIDWRYTYRSIEAASRRYSQFSFIELYRKGLIYRQEAPTIWCPECHTAIAQAELNDLERASEFVTLNFHLEDGRNIPVATTRPELLPACVAIFIHPEDRRWQGFAGEQAIVPLFGQKVPILFDSAADPEKGTGVVMCCTFGDSTDVSWWYTHKLPLVETLNREGKMSSAAGEYAGLPVEEARQRIKTDLEACGMILDRQTTLQSVRVHERCDTPVEYIVTRQWFVRLLENRQAFLQAGERILWHPEHMHTRYKAWVENLSWDWCISRQRYFGVPFPVWYCVSCGEILLAEVEQLPVDPVEDKPSHPCPNCGSFEFEAEKDVMDTWATSSLSPQIAGEIQVGEPCQPGEAGGGIYRRVFPYALRPQGQEIIRTWAFYTIVKSHYHCNTIPWKEVMISGWGLAGEGMGKLSKSRSSGLIAPLEMIERYSADAVRYWASSAATGKDAIISEEKIQMGNKLVTKLWNVARFCERFLQGYDPSDLLDPALERQANQRSPHGSIRLQELTPADRWILSRSQQVVLRVTEFFEKYEYASAKSEIETFFWTEMADNYLEMCKQRLYDESHPSRKGALFTIYHLLTTTIKLLAPILPYVTEEIYFQMGFNGIDGSGSIHTSAWPQAIEALLDDASQQIGSLLVEIATAIRRYKSENNLPLRTELNRLQLAAGDGELLDPLKGAISDLASITRARKIEIVKSLSPGLIKLELDRKISAGIEDLTGQV